MSKKIRSSKAAAAQSPSTDSPEQEPASKKATTRPGKKVVSLIVDERWAARVSLCARALGKSQTQYIVEVVSKNLKANLASALDALRSEVE